MKSILLSTIFLVSSVTLFAQSRSAELRQRQFISTSREYHPLPSTQLVDTVVSVYADRATAAYLFQALSPDKGYIFGTYYFFDTGSYYRVTDESGIGFDAVTDATIIDVLFWAGKKYVTGGADSVTMKIYSSGPDSMPVSVLASGRMSMDDIDTSSTSAIFTDMAIDSGSANISVPFFVSLSYEGNDDSLALFTSGPGNGNNEKRIRQLKSADFGGGWIRSGELFGFTDVDLFYIPVATLNGVGTNDHFGLKDAMVSPVYPTPSNDEVHLDYTLKNNSTVSYCLFDLRGKKYAELKNEQQHAGAYSQTFDVSKFAAGNYFLTVNINGSAITQKVIVAR